MRFDSYFRLKYFDLWNFVFGRKKNKSKTTGSINEKTNKQSANCNKSQDQSLSNTLFSSIDIAPRMRFEVEEFKRKKKCDQKTKRISSTHER